MKAKVVAIVSSLVLAALHGGAAYADLSMSIGGQVGTDSSTADYPGLSSPSVPVMSLYGEASQSSAYVDENGVWPLTCTGPGCGVGSTGQTAFAQGEIRADLGRFRAYSDVSVTTHSGSAGTLLGLNDVLTFMPGSSPTLDVHLDLDLDAFDSAGAGSGYSIVTVEVSLSRQFCDTDIFTDGCDNPVFYFEAREYSNGLHSWRHGSSEQNIGFSENASFAGPLDLSIGLTEFGNPLNFDMPYVLSVDVWAYSQCDGTTSACSTAADFSGTGYIGITGNYISENGYLYPGVAAVPEPENWAMLLAGLALVGWAAKWRKN